jgi:hypothetical protein
MDVHAYITCESDQVAEHLVPVHTNNGDRTNRDYQADSNRQSREEHVAWQVGEHEAYVSSRNLGIMKTISYHPRFEGACREMSDLLKESTVNIPFAWRGQWQLSLQIPWLLMPRS